MVTQTKMKLNKKDTNNADYCSKYFLEGGEQPQSKQKTTSFLRLNWVDAHVTGG